MVGLTWLRRYKVDIASALLALPAVAFAAVAAVTHGYARFWWIVSTVAATLAKVLFDSLRSSRAITSAEDVTWRTHLAISDSFGPLLGGVARLVSANKRDREQHRSRLIALIVTAAANTVGPDTGVRAAFYRFQTDPDENVVRMTLVESVGRADPPRTTFEANTEAGNALITELLADRPQFCEDVAEDPPPGWDGQTRAYRTYLSVPVRGSDRILGMLAVDAPQPRDLSEERDQPVLRVLARMLGLSQFSGEGPL